MAIKREWKLRLDLCVILTPLLAKHPFLNVIRNNDKSSPRTYYHSMFYSVSYTAYDFYNALNILLSKKHWYQRC